MMRIKFILMLLFSSSVLFSQNTTSSKFLYLFDENPSYISDENAIIYSVISRKLKGIKESPTTQIVGYNNNINSTIIGLSITNTNYGVSSISAVKFNYAHIIKFNNVKISMGLQTEARQYKVDESLYILDNINDPAITSGLDKQILPESAASFYLKTRKVSIGLTLYDLMNSDEKLRSYNSEIEDSYNFKIIGNYNASINQKMSINSSVFICKKLQNTFDYSGMILAEYDKKVGFGVFYENNIGVVTTVKRENIRINYLHSFPYAKISEYSIGTDEFSVSFLF